MPPATGFSAAPIRVLASAMWWVGFAGCYNPSTLSEGAPCQRTEQCPESQQCVRGSCSRSVQSSVDATPLDAMADAMVDAMPVPCNADGLTCGGTPTVFLCGTQCWVKCTDMVPRGMADTRCTGWTGALGEIDDASEQTCVASHIMTVQIWLGGTQGAGAMAPNDKWTWNGDATRPLDANHYTNWAQGKPDDAGGGESGDEQCAAMLPGGGWDDDPCDQMQGFFCRRSTFR